MKWNKIKYNLNSKYFFFSFGGSFIFGSFSVSNSLPVAGEHLSLSGDQVGTFHAEDVEKTLLAGALLSRSMDCCPKLCEPPNIMSSVVLFSMDFLSHPQPPNIKEYNKKETVFSSERKGYWSQHCHLTTLRSFSDLCQDFTLPRPPKHEVSAVARESQL